MDAGQQFRQDRDAHILNTLSSFRNNGIYAASWATDKGPDAAKEIRDEIADPKSGLTSTLRLHRKVLHDASPEVAGQHLAKIVSDGSYKYVPGLLDHHLDHYMSHPGITDNHLMDHILSAGVSKSNMETLMNHPRIAGNTNLKALIALSGGR